MSRERPVRAFLLIVLAAAWLGPLAREQRAAAQVKPPNVLIVLTDDQRLQTYSAMPRTRHWFIQKGVRLTKAFATTPWCCPSRATIYTGRYAHNHGVVSNSSPEALSQDSTVQRYLREAGYRTGIFGKYLNSWDLSVDPPHFDEWAVYAPVSTRGYSGAKWNVSGKVRKVEQYSTTYIRKRGLAFLEGAEADDDRPWFLELSTWAPHLPAVPQAKYEDAKVKRWKVPPSVKELDRSDKPPYIRDADLPIAEAKRIRRDQLRTLMSVDDLVEAVMRRLGALKERGNTLVFVLSDNGFLWSDHGWKGKTVPYSYSIRIPMLVRWPGVLEAGTKDGRLLGNVDVAPTILAAAGITPDPQYPVDGRSILDPFTRDRMLTEHWAAPGGFPPTPTWASLRTSEWQYVEYYDEAGVVTFREYYDLIEDPHQLVNLLGDGDASNDPAPEAVADISAQLNEDRLCLGTLPPAGCP